MRTDGKSVKNAGFTLLEVMMATAVLAVGVVPLLVTHAATVANIRRGREMTFAALLARERLAEQGVRARVVSMPSWELFERQPQSYRDEVLPPEVTARLAIEAGVPQGWYRYVGSGGDVIGIERFGASAPYKVLWEKYGFTAENIADRALKMLERGET